MEKAKWIWYSGEYEIYHNLQLHTRRFDMGCDYPTGWSLSPNYPRANFTKKVTFPEDTEITVHANGAGLFWLSWHKFPVNRPVIVPKGSYDMVVHIMNTVGLAAIFIDSEYVRTDSSWKASFGNNDYKPVGCEPVYFSADDDVEKFPFSYAPLNPVSCENIDGGELYDYGRETYGSVKIHNADPSDEIAVCFGESREEALDRKNAIVTRYVSGDTEYSIPPTAFRYIHITDSLGKKIDFTADYEYIPVDDTGFFSCDDELVQKIYDVSAYTFHLNTREFYLDGIKRDRWVWAGDAYQSFMINNYLYMEPSIIRRTIRALLGKPPIEHHVNTINDYSMYLIISVFDYYFSSGDRDFVIDIFDRVKALYSFIHSRLDDKGFVCKRDGDWVFIDWSDFDKSGDMSAEQILLWKVEKCMAQLCDICGEDGSEHLDIAQKLHDDIDRYYWNDEKGAYIDCFESGKNHVTRHANIFALLYDFADKEKQTKIIDNVLENDEITQITTPYFKFFELMAMCKAGKIEYAQRFIDSYWGGMIALGATSVWEAFDPNMKGTEHLAMYGAKYGKSLCHAWGSGPIYLLGRYILGVYPTSVGYDTFTVEPHAGKYQTFEGCVPLKNGKVTVKYIDNTLEVSADCDGGTLAANGTTYPIIKNEKLILNNSQLN